MIYGFTAGSFDLLHAGHVYFLARCKEQCDFLIVGLQVDPSKDRGFKNKPVQTIFERCVQIEACKPVNSMIIYETEHDLENYLYANEGGISKRFLGEEYMGRCVTANDAKIELVYIPRKHDYSSTELRSRVYQAELNKYAAKLSPNPCPNPGDKFEVPHMGR